MAAAEQSFATYQNEIYLGGMGGQRPELPLRHEELEQRARECLSEKSFGYVAGGAGSEDTIRENLEAFRRWRIVPRMLRDVAERDLSSSLLGTELDAPVLLAPVGVLSILHEEGELAVARASAELGVPFILSTASSYSMEEVAEAAGDGPRWFQLYWPSERELTRSFLHRAEQSGYAAVVVTLDTWLLGWRPRDLRSAYLPFLEGVGTANYFSDPVFRAALERPPEEDRKAAVGHWLQVYSDPTVTWDDLAFLRESTDLPLILKGVLHPEDARRAVEAGVQGLIVSNHGGRQVDGAVATLDALPDVVGAVPDDFPVLLDGGVRTGSDALKALALGAAAVLLGRPYAWGLAVGGEAGVRHVARCMLAELDLSVALSGLTSLAGLDPTLLKRSTHP